jgi:hypothetical protein
MLWDYERIRKVQGILKKRLFLCYNYLQFMTDFTSEFSLGFLISCKIVLGLAIPIILNKFFNQKQQLRK